MNSPFMIGLIAVFILLFVHDAVCDWRAYKLAMAKLRWTHKNNNQDWGP